MEDYSVFQDALDLEDNYMSSLSRSLSLVLDEFYEDLPKIGVSSYTGIGFEQLYPTLQAAKEEFI